MKPKLQFAASMLFITVAATPWLNPNPARDQDTTPSTAEFAVPKATVDVPQGDAGTTALHEKLKNGLSNTKFIGQFTMTGQESDKAQEEEYTITTVRKLEKGDFWEITARIKYGDHDVTVPMAMEIKWAGTTPVITVDRLFVPGLGTFDARVLLRMDQYAGTWSHGDVGGHLFGRIERIKPPELPKPPEQPEQPHESGH